MTLNLEYSDKGYHLEKSFLSFHDCNHILSQTTLHNETTKEFPYSDCDTVRIFNFNYNPIEIENKAFEITGKNFKSWMQKVNIRNKFDGSGEFFHQDYWWRKDEGIANESYMQCFIALADLKFCPLYIFEGSHKKLYDHEMFLERTGISKYKVKNEDLEKLTKFKTVHMNKGDALFFNYQLVHGSGSNPFQYDQPRAIFQLKEHNTIANSHNFSNRKQKEIEMLQKFIDFKNKQDTKPWGYTK